jgi:hypothetical protein
VILLVAAVPATASIRPSRSCSWDLRSLQRPTFRPPKPLSR